MSTEHQYTEDEKQPLPSSIEVEQLLLGSILVNNELYYATDLIKPEHFYEPLHARIYETISKLLTQGRTASAFSVAPHLKSDPVLQDCGGPSYLAAMASAAAGSDTPLQAKDLSRQIYDLSVRRGLIEIGNDLCDDAYTNHVDDTPDKLIERAEQALYSLAAKGVHKGAVSFATAMQRALEATEAAFSADGALVGIETSLPLLDRWLGGLRKGHLIVLAGRPGMGKSLFMGQQAFHAAKRDKRVLIFSMEMSEEQIASRLLASHTGLSPDQIDQGRVNRAEFERLASGMKEIQSLPLHIDSTGGLSIGQIMARARRLQRTQGLDIIFIDYLQLMQSPYRSESRVQALTEITTGLKALAKDLGIPIVLLSQLSRAVEHREDKRPMLADLRESGSIEQDADSVIFLYREAYYHQQKGRPDDPIDAMDWDAKLNRIKNKGEVIVSKNRHGKVGTVPVQAIMSQMRFLPDHGEGE